MGQSSRENDADMSKKFGHCGNKSIAAGGWTDMASSYYKKICRQSEVSMNSSD